LDTYSANTLLDKIFFFELALFSFLTGNSDMHLKNFSMIEQTSGWGLAPAYDLLNVAIVLPEDDEELALTLCGKKKKLKREHFVQLGEGMGLTSRQIEGSFKRMVKNRAKVTDWIERSFLSEKMKRNYLETVIGHYDRLSE